MSGLQNHLEWFDSASRLHFNLDYSFSKKNIKKNIIKLVKFQKCDRLMAHQKNGEVENEKGVEKKL